VGRKVPFIIEVVDGGLAGLPRFLQVSNLRIGDSFRFRIFARNSRHESKLGVLVKGDNEVRKTDVADPPDLLPLSLPALEASNLREPFLNILFCESEMNS